MKIKQLITPNWLINSQYAGLVLFLIAASIKWDAVKYQIQSLNPSKAVFLFLIIISLQLVHTRYHEYCHYLTAKFLGYESTVSIKEKLCITHGEIKGYHFCLIAAAPFLLDFLIVYSLFLIFPSQGFIIGVFIIQVIASSISDIYYSTSSIPYLLNRNIYFKYDGKVANRGSFGVYNNELKNNN